MDRRPLAGLLGHGLDLLTLCGNRRLVDTVAALRDQTRLYGLESLTEHGRLGSAAREHRDFLAAIAGGDTAGLEGVVRRHLKHVRADWAGIDPVS